MISTDSYPNTIIDIPRIDVTSPLPGLNELLSKGEGIVIKNFTTKLDNVEQALIDISNSNIAYVDKTSAGIMYPMVYPNLFMSDVYKAEGITGYGKHLEQQQPKLDSIFKFDFFENFVHLLNKLALKDGYKVEQLSLNGGLLSPFSVRSLRPESGNIPAHTEKFLTGAFAEQLSHTPLNMSGEIWSFFLLVQNAEEGGDLIIYDVAHKDSHSKESLAHDNIATDKDDADNLDNAKSEIVKLEPGDLILFNAGKWWHKITTVQGPKNRITIGGFLGFNKDNNTLFYWS